MTDERRHRAVRRRRGGAVAMYNQVFVRLIVAATITFVVIFAAASVYLVPLGQRSVRGVLPVADAFMRAGAAGDLVSARLLLSTETLRDSATVDQLLAQPNLFTSFDGLVTESFEVLPPAQTGGVDMAVLRATVRYVDRPAAQLDAVLVLENEQWRINDLRIVPLTP